MVRLRYYVSSQKNDERIAKECYTRFMAGFFPSKISLDSEILQLLEAISRKQGELAGFQRNVQADIQIENIATVDSVHFSTKIEGNTLSRDQVTQALQTKTKVKSVTRDLREVLNYSYARRKIKEWVQKHKSLSEEWVLDIHSDLLRGIVVGKLRGHYRNAQVVIKDSRSREIIYLAPESQDVPTLMKGLISWARKETVAKTSPLLVAAQFHFEFVTIHPFMDGNGRLGRLITNGILSAGGYDIERYAALEKQHEKDRANYYRSLRGLQGGRSGNYYDIPLGQDIHSWIVYWLKCLLATYEEGLSRIQNYVVNSSSNFTFDLRLQKAESLFKRHIRLRASEYADLVGLARTQAVADLNKLVEAGTLDRVKGGRSTIYQIKRDRKTEEER